VDRSTVSRRASRFREVRVTINDDQRPGRPKTSTDERSVKLVGGLSCTTSSRDVRGNIKSYREFTNISIPYFGNRFAKKKKNLCPMGPSLLDC